MWVICRITKIMTEAGFIAIEYIISSACDVDGIDEAIFTEGIGKVPEGFLVASGDVVKLVANTTNGTTLHLAMQEETAWNHAIADEDELTEERASTFLNEVLHLLTPRYTDDAIAAQHGHIAQAMGVALTLLAIDNQ